MDNAAPPPAGRLSIAEAMFMRQYLVFLMIAERLGLTLEDVRAIEAEVRAEAAARRATS